MKLIKESLSEFVNTKKLNESYMQRQEIEEWFKEFAPDAEYKVFDDSAAVYSDLDLFQSEVMELPDNLTVYGNLDLRQSLIEELPAKLYIKGDLILTDTKITEIPEDIIVNGRIYDSKM